MVLDPIASSRIFTLTPALALRGQRRGEGAPDLAFPVDIRLDGDRGLRGRDLPSMAG